MALGRPERTVLDLRRSDLRCRDQFSAAFIHEGGHVTTISTSAGRVSPYDLRVRRDVCPVPDWQPIPADSETRARLRSKLRTRLTISSVFLGIALGAPRADASITRIEITRVESPTFEGASFGEVGQYEKIVGRAFGEVDPNDSRNRVIADIRLAPRNARGTVEYSTDIYILRPMDRSAGNQRMFFEINNRGNNLSFGLMNSAPTAVVNDPTSVADSGNGFLMRQGYTIVLSGWDAGVTPGDGRQTLSVPTVRNPDGSPVVGPALEEFVIDNSTTMTGVLTYPTATMDKSQASLTVRVHYSDPPIPVPSAEWEYVNFSTIRLLPAGTPFQQGRLYEFTYPATDPILVGIGFAATRDLAAFFRRATRDSDGNANPLAGNVQFIYSFCASQPCRFLRDFLHLGFNEDEQGQRVFDGMLHWIGGASGGFFNYRFAQPGRTHRQHIGRWYPERQFPFANQVLNDPITGKTDGRLRRCLANGTCPKIFEVNSANEYWVKGSSLLHTDTRGNDLPDPPNVRFYLFSSLPHNVGVGPTGPGICQQPRNPLVANAGLRALLVALDEWVSTGREPPASRVPRRADGTLVAPLPQAVAGFPTISGVLYHGLMSTGDLFDYGNVFEQGILTTLPPFLMGSPYPVFVPKTDSLGNDIAGIRLPEVAVPVATYTGWGVRAAAFGGDDLCDAAGAMIPLRRTQAERLAASDPRPSLEELYGDHWGYVLRVTRSALSLFDQRLLLWDDVYQIFLQGARSRVLLDE
jgi:hypothetical protein